MSNYDIKFLEQSHIDQILPLLSALNQNTSVPVLKERLKEMFTQNYKCLGIYDQDQMIGICGLWFMTRHYCGRSIEPDHVYVLPDYQNKGVGKVLFDWIFDYAAANRLEATELNSYVNNPRSHKFYFNLGYEIKGFHFVKQLD